MHTRYVCLCMCISELSVWFAVENYYVESWLFILTVYAFQTRRQISGREGFQAEESLLWDQDFVLTFLFGECSISQD